MASLKQSTEQSAVERIRKAALRLFTERGYHGTSMRDLAGVVRLEAASLYHHFPSKQHILYDLFERVMDDLLANIGTALASAEGVEDQLRAVARAHVFFHIERQEEAFVSHSELRSLTPANREQIVAKRDRYEELLRELLAAGVTEGVFEIRDVRLATIAILMMLSGVSDWFTGNGRLSADAVADAYAEMVLRLLRRSPHQDPTFDKPVAGGPPASGSWRALPHDGQFHQ